MRFRRFSRGILTGIVALAAAVITLVAIYYLAPEAFAIALAIGGLTGALYVIYEVRLTKRIAEAEFIRMLNDGFVGDPNINEIWKKLLLGEEIGPTDRFQMSTYLTFFETIHLLLGRGVLDFKLVDNLFRNRFFRAIGDPGIQGAALIRDREAFVNVHDLIEGWRDYLRSHRIRIPPGYYAYARAYAEADGFELSQLSATDLPELIELQDDVIADLRDRAWLRQNTLEMLQDCLENHVVLGAYQEGRLVAAGVLYDPGTDEENIKRYLTEDADDIAGSCNLKIVFVAPHVRGRGLAKVVIELLEHEAAVRGHRFLLCTIHPKNVPSQRLFSGLGYERRKRATTKYGSRYVFENVLSTAKKSKRPAPTPAASAGAQRSRRAVATTAD